MNQKNKQKVLNALVIDCKISSYIFTLLVRLEQRSTPLLYASAGPINERPTFVWQCPQGGIPRGEASSCYLATKKSFSCPTMQAVMSREECMSSKWMRGQILTCLNTYRILQ